MGNRAEAGDAYREAIALVRPYAEKWPGGPLEKLLRQIESDLRDLEEL
jgi:hypothetical protein